MSEKLLRGHGEPYLPVIIVDRLTVVPCTVDGKNQCTWGWGELGASEMLAVAHYFTCAVCVVQPFVNVTMKTINTL